MDQKTKVAVVTGSSSGIGKAIAEALLAAGYKVYGIARSTTAIEHSDFVSLAVDLTRADFFKSVLQQIAEDKIDVLINNAGVALERKGLDFSEEHYRQTFDLNFKAPIILTQTLKDKVIGGQVVTVSSVSDRLVGESHAMYCASKAALSKYIETVAMEERGIKFITLLPSYVDTPLLRKLHGDEPDFNWGEIIKPEQMAEFVVRIIDNQYELASGAKIIVVSENLGEDLTYEEDLLGYNVTTKELTKL